MQPSGIQPASLKSFFHRKWSSLDPPNLSFEDQITLKFKPHDISTIPAILRLIYVNITSRPRICCSTFCAVSLEVAPTKSPRCASTTWPHFTSSKFLKILPKLFATVVFPVPGLPMKTLRLKTSTKRFRIQSTDLNLKALGPDLNSSNKKLRQPQYAWESWESTYLSLDVFSNLRPKWRCLRESPSTRVVPRRPCQGI